MADIQQKIKDAKAAGYSDDEITQHLSQTPDYGPKIQAAIAEKYTPAEIITHLSTAPAVAPAAGEIPAARKPAQWNEFLNYVGPSVAQQYKNVVNMVTSPVETIRGMSGLMGERSGAFEAQANINKELQGNRPQAAPVPGTFAGDFQISQAARIAQAKVQSGELDKHFMRYSTPEGIKQALITDPAGTAMDLSMLLSGTAGVARAGSRVTGAVGKSARDIERAAQFYDTAATYTNPFTPAIAAGKALISPIAPYLDKFGRYVDTALQGKLAESTAARVAQEAAGGDINAIRAAQKEAPSTITAGQATADIGRSQYQALADLARTKDTQNYFSRLDELQAQNIENKLANIAGGSTQTEIINNLRKSEQALNELTTPMRQTELAAANTGKLKQQLEGQATELGGVAAGKVDDVRRFVAARDRLGGGVSAPGSIRKASETGMPTPNKYTIEGEMSAAAERVATKAAEDSLKYGQGAQFAQNRADSLAQYGLKPLDTNGVIRDINAKLNDPKIGVSDVNRKVLTAVGKKIEEWTARNGGVIDANALYEIRKNTINEVVEKLTAGQNPSVAAKRATQLLTETKPLIDDAIVKAGGTGWKDYLDTFSKGKDVIAQRKFAGMAKKLYEENPAEFQRLIKGNRPDLVEGIFGKGRIDVRAEMGDKFKVLDEAAHSLERAGKMAKSAELGAADLADIVKKSTPTLRIPFFGLKASVGNAVLKELSGKLSAKTMAILEEGFKSGKNANELLDKVPFSDRSRIYNAVSKVNRLGVGVVSNALAPDNRNNLGK
jgi:hypothetical protein